MARYELRFKTSVAKDLRDVPKTDLRRILERIESLRQANQTEGGMSL